MDVKSFIIGVLLTALVFVVVGFGGSSNGRYQVSYIQGLMPKIFDTQTGVAKVFIGEQVLVYDFNKNLLDRCSMKELFNGKPDLFDVKNAENYRPKSSAKP
jgi:hypothetical protein